MCICFFGIDSRHYSNPAVYYRVDLDKNFNGQPNVFASRSQTSEFWPICHISMSVFILTTNPISGSQIQTPRYSSVFTIWHFKEVDKIQLDFTILIQILTCAINNVQNIFSIQIEFQSKTRYFQSKPL